MSFTNRYIITGGPGSGKSTLLNALKREGYKCYDEISRIIIQEQQQTNGDKVPWKNLNAFAHICYNRMAEQLKETPQEICFFDRGLPDVIAYLKRGNIAIAPYFYEQCKDYNNTVFIAPPWQDIFINDTERPETYRQSVEIYQQLQNTYSNLGFQLIELPKVSVAERVGFVQRNLMQSNDFIKR